MTLPLNTIYYSDLFQPRQLGLRVLVACEYSGTIRNAFLALWATDPLLRTNHTKSALDASPAITSFYRHQAA